MGRRIEFLKFLAEYNALIPYILNFDKGPLLEFTISYDPEDFITCAFIWGATSQGFHYWANLSDKWRQKLHSLNS